MSQLICHFTKMSTALENILSSKKLRLSPMGRMNDPREAKPWNIPLPLETPLIFQENVRKVMQEEWKVACFTSPSTIQVTGRDSNRKFPVLIDGYFRAQMWAHYAENHRGVCLLFDQDRLNENLKQKSTVECEIYQGDVEYNVIPSHTIFTIPPLPKNTQNLDIHQAAQEYVRNNYKYFFLRKHFVWEYEAEYRWLVHSHEEYKFVSIEGAILHVLVGPDFHQAYIPSLKELCRELGISAGKLNWNNGVPITEFGSIYQP